MAEAELAAAVAASAAIAAEGVERVDAIQPAAAVNGDMAERKRSVERREQRIRWPKAILKAM
jgi:hypothetical protein